MGSVMEVYRLCERMSVSVAYKGFKILAQASISLAWSYTYELRGRSK